MARGAGGVAGDFVDVAGEVVALADYEVDKENDGGVNGVEWVATDS